jgi:two-component system sensor histidine kinase HydH
MTIEVMKMPLRSLNPTKWAWFSPWMIIGSVCILGVILSIVALQHIQQEKKFMERTLLSEANILMRSIEAIGRVGMMRMGWGCKQLQLLMEETAQQPDVIYVALVNREGRIVAHSQMHHVGSTISHPLKDIHGLQYHFVDEGSRVFEAIHRYQPWDKHQGRNWGRRHHGRNSWCERRGMSHRKSSRLFPQPFTADNLFILVGLDPAPFETSIRRHIQQAILLFGVLFIAGAAGFVSLTWAHNYRKTRRSLQDIQAFTSTILRQMPVGLMATDLQGRIQTTNETAQRILRQPIPFHTNIDQFPSFAPIAQRLQKEEKVVDEEVYCRVNEGQSVPLHVNSTLIRDGQNNIVGSVFLFTDSTHLKQLEEQLRRSERLASLGRLAAGVAHEIRNPLSSIKGFAAILAGKIKGDVHAQQIAQVMQQEVERINRSITELLDFARPTELHKRSCVCRDLITDILRLVEQDAHQGAVAIDWNVTPEDLQIQVDPDRFAQILLNLYLNALQAMEQGGTLTVDVRQQSDQIVWKVTDSGKGIAPQDIAHIFDPYFTTKPRGVGLGLAIVHKLVEAHGGDIEVSSSPGEGTSFIIHLPQHGREVFSYPPVLPKEKHDLLEREI